LRGRHRVPIPPGRRNYIWASSYGFSEESETYLKDYYAHHTIEPGRGRLVGRVAQDKGPVQISDVLTDSEYTWIESPKVANFRTIAGVPLLREGVLIGVLGITRSKVRPFTNKQIDLLTTFADQTVIAIENARLFEEVQARTRDLSESLKQQTATSEVLQVISSSPGELQPVFETMLERATRLCDAKFATLYLREGEGFRAVAANHDAPPAYVEARMRERQAQPAADGPLGAVARTKQVTHIADLSSLRSYSERHPFVVASVELGGFRTALGVPLLKDDQLVGSISVMRQEVRPFTDKQIKLVESFAAQAVIAIENTRLLNELRESPQQQTATSDVLKVISRSTFDLKSVLNTLVESVRATLRSRYGGHPSSERIGLPARGESRTAE
jgi:GAF domain-containing protein